MPTMNAMRTFEPPPVPPFAEFERRRSAAATLTNNSDSSMTSSNSNNNMRCMSVSSTSTRSKNSARPKSAKFSAYRLRSNSGLSLHTNDDILRQYTDYYPDGTPRVALYGSGNAAWPGERLRSIDSVASSQRSSMAYTDSDTSADLPIPDFVGRDMFEMVMKDPAASSQLWKFAASRGVGQNVDYLMKIRDYTHSLEQVVVQLSAISTSYTSITATSPINLPSQMSKTLNLNIKHLTTSLIPSLENMFLESKAYVEQRIVREIFPAFVKRQLSLCTSLAMSSDVEGDSQQSEFPGLRSSFCLSDPAKTGNPVVYASDDFEELTGYPRFEVLSRNCRFLQGPQTDRETIARMRSAVWRREESTELVLNFRRDGSPFWNLLWMCPLLDASGKPRFYMGAQIDVSSSVESNEDVLKMLSYGFNEEGKVPEPSPTRWSGDGSQSEVDMEDAPGVKQNTPLKAPKKSFFKTFKKMPPPPLSPPLSPRRSSDRPRSSAGPGFEKTYSTRTVLKRLSTQTDLNITPYSRYMVLEHVPSYPASLASMPLDQEMRYPPKLHISFCSPAIAETLDLGVAADAIMNKDIFDVLAEQATLPSVTKAFKSTVREVVVRDGKSITLDLALANHIPKRANLGRVMSGESGEAGREKKSNKMISHWTPLKDADDQMSSRHHALLGRITSLKNATFALCGAVGSYLKTADSQHKLDLKAVLVELRLLGGVLYSLQELLHELQEDDDDAGLRRSVRRKIEWPVLEGLEMLVETLSSAFQAATPEGLREAKSAIVGYRSKLGFVLGSSEKIEDVSLHFSVLGKEPTLQLLHGGTRGSSHTLSDVAEDIPGPAEVSAWLAVLNSLDNDREPAEYCREKGLVQSRRLTTPQYQIAAARWPKYAEKYWPQLKPQICTLFRTPRSFNFVQWVLEYARETYPRTFGSSALSPKVLLELTDALCGGAISSFHIAAALGLPKLCQALISMGADVNQVGLLGSPLFCALVGPKVLATGATPESWTSLLDDDHVCVDRAQTVLFLITIGADSKYQYQWKNADEASMAGLAFWVALITKNEAIFSCIIGTGAALDTTFLQLIQRSTVSKHGRASKKIFSELLTYVYDFTLAADIAGAMLEKLRETVCKVMNASKVGFTFTEGSRLACIDDGQEFEDLVRSSILEIDATLLRRLTVDPRFNPNLPYDDESTGGTILHMASEGAQLETIDILIKAGADITAKDDDGRTPLMVVEDKSVLAHLILEHGASTTDVDHLGRTIWHLAASTNDVVLLKWLCENDAEKARCMAMVSSEGHTPLADACHFVRALKGMPKGSKAHHPTAALMLLKEWHAGVPLECKKPLTHAAVEWGSLELLDGLLQAGADAKQLDEQGRSMMHMLNLSADEELVNHVLQLCQGAPIMDKHGNTAAVTILTNTVLYKGARLASYTPTAHPSCNRQLYATVYKLLLTDEVLKCHDAEGRGLWQRFCERVIPMLAHHTSGDQPHSLQTVSSSILLAVSCLGEHGVIADFERETGKSAISCVLTDISGDPAQLRYQFQFLPAILEAPNTDASRKLASVDGTSILVLAVQFRMFGLVELLIEKGVPLGGTQLDGSDRLVVENLLALAEFQQPLLDLVLKHAEPNYINKQQTTIYTSFLRLRHRPDSLRILKRLLDGGMDPNQVPATLVDEWERPKIPTAMLPRAILLHDHDLATFLLDNGADPSFGPNGYNAVIAAAESGCDEILGKIINMVDPKFNWLCLFNYPGKPTFNPLQMAAFKGQDSVLEMLLEDTKMKDGAADLVTDRNKSAPIHLAIGASSLSCVKTLVQHGADLGVLDRDGMTPLGLAITNEEDDIINYLIVQCVRAEANGDPSVSDLFSAERPMTRSLTSRPGFGQVERRSKQPPARTSLDGKKLGLILENILNERNGINYLKVLLRNIPKESIETAIMSCGCTPLSFAMKRADRNQIFTLLEHGIGGFCAGNCQVHWPKGFNALVEICLSMGELLCSEMDEEYDDALRTCLDGFLKEGLLWFVGKDCTPLHALAQLSSSIGYCNIICNARAMRIVVDHLQTHADEYWKLLLKKGLTPNLDLRDTARPEETSSNVLRVALNAPATSSHRLLYYTEAIVHDFDVHDIEVHDPNLSTGDVRHGVSILHVLAYNLDVSEDDEVDEEDKLASFDIMLDQLTSNGIDINAQDSSRMTALHVACDLGHFQVAASLLITGANPNLRDQNGHTPLTLAAKSRNPELIKLLITFGASIHTFQDVGNPLEHCENDLSMITYLLSLSLDPHVQQHGKASPAAMWLALEDVRTYVLNTGLIDFYRLAEEDPPVLCTFLSNGYTAGAVNRFLRRMPQECLDRVVNPKTVGGDSPSCKVMLLDAASVLEVLINFGLDLEQECSATGSAIMFACSMDALDSVKVLVRRGARLSYTTTDDYGRPIVRSALNAAEAYPRILHWLLVGRHQENRSLGWTDTSPGEPTRPWAGPRNAFSSANAHSLVGQTFPRLSMMGRLALSAELRRRLRGEVSLDVAFE
ncbi:hypothetical protein G7046_g766 [Stylonectria norvegica]|nr:hypothetical protein G7046_g766 [Stylonectria norvegica]